MTEMPTQKFRYLFESFVVLLRGDPYLWTDENDCNYCEEAYVHTIFLRIRIRNNLCDLLDIFTILKKNFFSFFILFVERYCQSKYSNSHFRCALVRKTVSHTFVVYFFCSVSTEVFNSHTSFATAVAWITFSFYSVWPSFKFSYQKLTHDSRTEKLERTREEKTPLYLFLTIRFSFSTCVHFSFLFLCVAFGQVFAAVVCLHL